MSLAPIAMALSAIGSVVSAVGAFSQGSAASSAASYNSQIAARDAQIAQQQAQSNADIQQRQTQQKLGAIVAGYGAGNVTMAGSPIDVLGNSAANAELDRQNIMYNGNLRALGYQSSSNLEASQSQVAMTQGVTSAGGDLLSGGANVIRMMTPGAGEPTQAGSALQIGG